MKKITLFLASVAVALGATAGDLANFGSGSCTNVALNLSLGTNQTESAETRLDLRLDAAARNPTVTGAVLHDGTLATNETWSAGTTHLVTTPFYVPSGRTLTIEEGAVVKFTTLAGIIVNDGGACLASNVTFTCVGDDSVGGAVRYNGETPAAQSGLYVLSGALATNETTQAKYGPVARLMDLGATTSASLAIDERTTPVWIVANPTNLAYSTRWDGTATGVAVTEQAPGAAKATLASGAANAEGDAAWSPDDGVGEYAFQHVTAANTLDATFVVPVPSVITNDLTLVGGGMTHYVPETVVVTNGATLTIEPGAIVKFAPGATISVAADGNFVAVGSSRNAILFTSAQDGASGLALPGFGTTPTVYDWPAFVFASGAEARLDYVEFRYCGSLNDWLDLAKFGANTTLDATLCGVSVTNTSDSARAVALKATKNGTYLGAICGNVAVTKTGSATLAFADTQTYTGGTKVEAGTLRMAGSETAFLTPIKLWYKKYGYDRPTHTDTSWKNMSLSEYDGMVVTNSLSVLGTGTFRTPCPEYFQQAQCRIEGWFYVQETDVGTWTVLMNYDDHMAIAIDNQWIVEYYSWNVTCSGTWTATAGWHRFKIVCGDTYGDYGSTSWSHPVHVSINGGNEMDFHETNFRMAGYADEGTVVEEPSVRELMVTLADGTVVPGDPEKADALWKNNFLTHRWSFNGTLEDSVGGQTATLCGSTLPTFQESNTVIRLPGGSWGNGGWVSLGSYAMPTNGPVTMEFWGVQNAIRAWSRVFDFGSGTDHYMYLSWSRNSAGTECFGIPNLGLYDKMGGFALGEMFHISLSFVPLGSDQVQMVYSKRNCDTGDVLAQYITTISKWIDIRKYQASCNLGHSFFSADHDASADYDEVRIWNAALSEEQLTANAKAGPDNVLSLKSLARAMPSYEVAEGATLDVNGGTLYCNNVAGSGTVQNALLAVGGSVDAGLVLQGVSVAGDDSPRVRVTFDLCGRGSRSGGGALVQDITSGTGASAPTVRANGGWRFVGWDVAFDHVTENLTVTAQYQSMRVDLQITDIAVTNAITSGETLDLGWTLGNFGNVDFNGKLVEEVRLVKGAVTNVIWQGGADASVLTNATLLRCAQWQVPLKGWAGEWQVQIETAIGAAYEVAENNVTTSAKTLTIVQAPLPDLLTRELTLSAKDLRPLDTVTVSYVVQNAGDGLAKAPWVETLYAAQNGTVVKLAAQAITNNLAVGATAARKFSAEIPQLFPLAGNVAFYVKVDSGDALVEKNDDESAEETWAPNATVAKRLYLTAAKTTVAENNAGGVRLTAKRSGPIGEAVTVEVGLDLQDGTTPATLTFAAGARTATFDFIPTDNAIVDGSRTATITLTATGYESASTTLTITDNEVPSLTLSLDRTAAREGEGVIKATVTRDLVTSEDLVVYISGNFGGQCSCPTSVTIKGGEASATFDVTLLDDAAAEAAANVSIKVTASGFTASTQTVAIADDDVPGVTFSVTPDEISEGAGANAVYATLTRRDSDTVDQAITVAFSVSESGRLVVPETVTIPKYTMSVRFAISTVDNSVDDGDREIAITGRIKLKNGSLAEPSDGNAILQTITVYDDDVPALSLKAEPSTMKEGVEHAGDLILSHNSTLEEDLEVTLTVDVEGEVSIPATVTIPAGERSVTIPVTTLADGEQDGGRLVSVYADDAGEVFKSASTWLQVSDVDLPDFRVESVKVPVSVYAGKKFEATFTISNCGFANETNDISYAVYLMKGTSTQPSETTKVGTGKIEGGLATNETTELIYTLSANDSTGDYRVAVVVDPGSEIGELDEADNTTYSSAISVGAAYSACAGTTKAVYAPGESVVITGRAVLTDGVSPAVQKPVDVYVIVSGARRAWSVTTDANGAFTHTFTPVDGEAGHYGVGAVYPNINATTAQYEFDILGFRRTSTARVVWDVSIGDVVTNVIRLQNLSGVDLTGLAVTVDGVPPECQLACELAETLPGNGTAELRLVATALADSPTGDYSAMTVEVTTTEGLSLSFPLYFHAKSLKAQLKASPTSIDAMMTVGDSRYFEVTIRNDGRGASGPITVALPEAPYLRLVSAATLDSLASGESAVIVFEVAPEEEHNLVLNSPLKGGQLAVNCANGTGAAVPLRFTPVSEATGSLVVDALDNNTYMLASAPHLAGATVRVSNPYTGAIVATMTTGSDGKATFDGLPQGKYNIRATAPNHATATDSVTIEPGGSVTSEIFLAYQLVSATWDVVPVEIEDSYEITLVLDFETTVPAPQVKITMPTSFAEMMPGDTTAFTIHVANTGLIRADEVTLTPPAIPGHTFTFQDNGFALAAGAARDIAVRFSRDADDPAGHVYMTDGQWAMMTLVAWPCGKERPVYEYPTYFSYGQSVYVDPIDELLEKMQDVRTYNEPEDGGLTRDKSGDDGSELDTGNMDDTDASTVVKTKGQAKVSLKLSQKLTMTREAFDGTLTVYNGHGSTPISDIALTLNITDSDGNVCNGEDTFVKLDIGEVLTEVAPNSSGTRQIRFIPTRQAAETEPTVYNIGGTLTYTDPASGERATLELVPAMITVHPSPYLKLDYFVQRDVYADDPLTEDVVEATEPAEIAVLVRNTGAGDAKGVTIASAQPEVFRNDSGLDIAFALKDFGLDSMAIDGTNANAGVKDVALGTIPAGESKIAQWWLTSTLSGHFIGMSASVTPLNSWNTPDTALVDSEVGVHKLIRSFAWNGVNHFLTCENDDDIAATPDTVFGQDGEGEAAYAVTGAAVDGSLVGDEVTLTVSASDVAVDWNYLETAVEGLSRYEVVSVTRNGSEELSPRCCWITDRIFRDGDEPLMEERLHIIDSLASATAATWTVVLKAKPSAAVEVVSFDVTDETVENELRDSVVVTFSAAIDPSSFTTADITFKHQGVTVADLSALAISVDGATASISGFAALAGGYGRNELTVQCAGIANLSGRFGETGKRVAWSYSSAEAPYIVDVTGAPVTRVNSFDSLTAVMSVQMDEESFADAYVTLNGRDVSSRVTFTSADALGTRWTLSGLEALQTIDGEYTLSIDCSSLKSAGGTSGALSFSQSWVRDTTAPSVSSFSRSSGMGGSSYRVGLSETANAGTVSTDNFTLTRNGVAVSLPATASVSGDGAEGWTLTGIDSACQQDGDYALTFSAAGVTDEAGNEASGSRSVAWKVNLTPPDEATDITVSSPYGSVGTRVITSSQTLTVGATVPEDGLTVEIVAKAPGGGESVLATPKVGSNRTFSAEVTLPSTGNYTLAIRLTDADGNTSETTFPVYVDGVELTATLSGTPEAGHAAGDVYLTFSEAVEDDDVLDAVCTLTLDGERLALSGVTVERVSTAAYVLSGLDEFTSEYGSYNFSVDVSSVRKLSSGKTCGSDPVLSWTNELVDEIAPTVAEIRFDGVEPDAEYVQMFTNVAVVFSEKVNIQQLIRKGMVGQALYVELLDANTNAYAVIPAQDAAWDDATSTVTWTVDESQVPCTFARVVINGSMVADLAGNKLSPVDRYGTIRSAKTYAPSVLLSRAAASYAAPTFTDWNRDGLLDLFVGELTPDGKGKVRIYLNRGSATVPSFEDFTYLDYEDGELALNGGADLGVHVSFEHSFGRMMTFVCGDGSVYEWWYKHVDRKTGEREEMSVAEDTLLTPENCSVCNADVNGDLISDLVTGDNAGNVLAYLGYSSGSFADEPIYLYSNEGTAGIVRVTVGDITGDGLDDIVVGRPDGSLVLLTASSLQSQTLSFERVRVIPIEEALTLDSYWQVGDGWSCEQVGHDARAVCTVADGGTCVMTSRFENAGTVTFKWGCTGKNASSVYTCAVDGSERLRRTGAFDVVSDSVRLEGGGSHYVVWRLSGNNKAILRDAVFDPDAPEQQIAVDGITSYEDIRSFARGIWSRAGGDYAKAVGATAANGRPVAENCIAGLDCDDPEARFVAKVEVVNGVPSVTWEPALNDTDGGKGVKTGKRTYRTYGKKTLGDSEWTEIGDGEESDYMFFRVSVEMP